MKFNFKIHYTTKDGSDDYFAPSHLMKFSTTVENLENNKKDG